MLVAYVSVSYKKAFCSVYCKALWDIMQLCGIPATICGLLTGLWTGSEYYEGRSALKCGGRVSSFIPVITRGRHGCILAPSHFNMYGLGAQYVGNAKAVDFVFAKDAVILARSLDIC